MLTITQGAEEALAMLRDTAEGLPTGGGVRITQDAQSNGETGFSLELVEAAEADDVVLEGHALPVFVEPEAALLLAETALDGEAHGDHVHFGFVSQDDADGDEAPGGAA